MADSMYAVRKLRPAPGLEYAQTEVPKPGDGEILIKAKACSMCGTDIHIYNWDPPWSQGRFIPPKTLGHEVNGEVIEIGKEVQGFAVGDSISAESHIPDWTCSLCKQGSMHICEQLKFFSIDTNGFFAPYAVLPASNAWKNPRNMKPEIATLKESMGNSVYTVGEGKVAGKNVAILGLGPTGLFAVGIAKVLGAAKVICVGGTETHRAIAKQMGADVIVNRHEEDAAKRVLEETDGKGPDTVLEMSGAVAAIQQSVDIVRPTGIVCVLGLPTQPVTLDIAKKIVLKDVTFRGIYGRKMWDTWKVTSGLLDNGKLDITPIITHRLKLSEFEQGIAAMQADQCGKVVMFPDEY
ncbi:MAG: alcohol dehydrogenase catalytic domain-containing protein [Candidatus Aenigmarchaeota archaeon]|nr:alcohol dehydrogenase catalytic domain-containing protein [Candidatus Aenigmarchaeota archaeon]